MISSTLKLTLSQQHSIPIYIGQECFEESFSLLNFNSQRYFIISQQHVYDLYGKNIELMIRNKGFAVHTILVDDGEQAKSITSYEKCIDKLFEIGVERSDTIIGVGGGVITDLAGFIASSVLRGLRLIHCPTTLLCQVDAAIGGKTGINHASGKNLIGAFYQPSSIIIDCQWLASLPLEEAKSGFAEIIKYGIIQDISLFNLLQKNHKILSQFDFKNEIKLWESIIIQSCKNKIAVVEADERESNIRAILNFGHTIGHGIEAYFKYSDYKHGECVAFGMVAATYIAQKKSILSPSVAESIYELIKVYGYHLIQLKSMDVKQLITIISRDKKVKHKTVYFVLPKQLGTVFISSDVSTTEIENSIIFLHNFFRGAE